MCAWPWPWPITCTSSSVDGSSIRGARRSCKPSARPCRNTWASGSELRRAMAVVDDAERSGLLCPILSTPLGLGHMLHKGKDNRAVGRHQHVFFKPARLRQLGMPGICFNGEIHVLLYLGRILEGVGAGNPHALVEGDANAVRELLQGGRSVLVIIVLREGRCHVRRRVARAQLLDAGVGRLIDLTIEINLLLRHPGGAFKA